MSFNSSESIFQKRIKRFKSIKRGYYSLIILIAFYVISILGPLWMNNKPLMIRFGNQAWDKGESYQDLNDNQIYDLGEPFKDKVKYYFPAIWDFLDFIPGIKYPLYESNKFNQDIIDVEVLSLIHI